MITCSVRAKFSISTKKNFGAVYEISFNASISGNLPGQFRTSVTESPSPQKNVHRRCFRRLVWKQSVLSRQSVGRRKQLGFRQAKSWSAVHGTGYITLPTPAPLPFLFCEDFSSPEIAIGHRGDYGQD